MKIQGIYKIVNTVNNKVYIGQSINIERRFKGHRDNINKKIKHPLYSSIIKYGIGNFEFIVLEEIDNVLLLDQREQYWMDHYKSYDKEYGYNLCSKAESNRGYKHSEESKKLNSIRAKERFQNEIFKSKMRESWKTRKLPSAETREKLSKAGKGKNRTQNTKDKMSDTWKILWGNENYKKQLLEKRKPPTQEQKDKIAKKAKERWANPEFKNKILKNRKKSLDKIIKLECNNDTNKTVLNNKLNIGVN